MKKTLATIMCAMLVLCVGMVFIPQSAQAETQYYATDFYGASDFVTTVETVSYSDRSQNNEVLALRTPEYIISGVTCVPIASANIIGFYDRYYTELIPNFDPGITYGTHYLYRYPDSEVTTMTLQLASDMGLTSPATQGATVTQCKNGMTKYCNRKSLSISFTSSMKNGKFNYDIAKAQLDQGLPILVFCSKFNLTTVLTANNVDTITYKVCSDPHAMAVFGYTEITYILNDGGVRTDKYLRVSSGLNNFDNMLLYISSNIDIDNAYAINIY